MIYIGVFIETQSIFAPSNMGIKITSASSLNVVPIIECRQTVQGTEYKGHKAQTWNGKECLPWMSVENLPESFVFPDDSIEKSFNYCRNPDNKTDGPWCYSMKIYKYTVQKTNSLFDTDV